MQISSRCFDAIMPLAGPDSLAASAFRICSAIPAVFDRFLPSFRRIRNVRNQCLAYTEYLPTHPARKNVFVRFGRIADEIGFIPVDLFVFEFHTKAG